MIITPLDSDIFGLGSLPLTTITWASNGWWESIFMKFIWKLMLDFVVMLGMVLDLNDLKSFLWKHWSVGKSRGLEEWWSHPPTKQDLQQKRRAKQEKVLTSPKSSKRLWKVWEKARTKSNQALQSTRHSNLWKNVKPCVSFPPDTPPHTSCHVFLLHLHRHAKVHLIATPLAAVHLFLQTVNASHAITQKGTGFLYFGHLRLSHGWWVEDECPWDDGTKTYKYFRKSRKVYPFQRKVVFQPLWFRGYVSSLEGINISGCYSPNGLVSCCFKYRLQHLALRYAWFEETRHSRPLLMWVD